MRIGIPVWNGRVSPVLDCAGRLLVVESDGGGLGGRRELEIVGATVNARANSLAAAGVDVLVCAGVSTPLAETLGSCGLRIISGVAGDVEDVLVALVAGDVEAPRFAMPGCCRRRRRGGRGGGGRWGSQGRGGRT